MGDVCQLEGVTLPSPIRVCLQSRQGPAPEQEDAASKKNHDPAEEAASGEIIDWQINMPLLTNRFMVYDLLKVWGLAGFFLFGLFAAVGLANREFEVVYQGLVVVGGITMGMLLLSTLVMLLYFGNRLPLRFIMGPAGVAAISLSTRGRRGSWAAVVIGLLSGKPTIAGAGMLAASRERTLKSWRQIYRVKIHPSSRVITLMNNWRVVIRLYCTPKNFSEVQELVLKWTTEGKAAQKKTPE